MLLVVAGTLAFSTKSILVKLAYGDGVSVDAVTIMAVRMLLALPAFLVAAVWTRRDKSARPLSAGDWGGILALGFFGYYLSSFLDFSGLAYISAGMERMILFTYPTLVVLITAVLGRRSVDGRMTLALVVSYAGLALVFMTGVLAQQADASAGGLLVFGAAVSFAVFTVGSGNLIPRVGAARFTAYSMSVACVLTVTHYLVVHGTGALASAEPLLPIGFTLALVATVLPAFLISAGVRRIGPSRAAVIGSVGPVGTLVLGYLVLHETVSPLQGLGTGLIMIGAMAAGTARSR
jgi:drug/metabolite transporter (DMT)-like permease